MHIILGLLGTIVTILILLKRLADAGIDIKRDFNPFLWHRRKQFTKKVDTNQLFNISNPMEATALLLVGAVKADGDMTLEEKQSLLQLFENDFNLSKQEAAGLLTSSVFLLGDGSELKLKLNQFMAPSKQAFSAKQRKSAVMLLNQIKPLNKETHESTKTFIAAAESALLDEKSKKTPTPW